MTATLLRDDGRITWNGTASNGQPRAETTRARSRVEGDSRLIAAARRYWMTRYRIPPEEIDEYCDLEQYPGTLEDELEQIAALPRLEELNRRIKWNV
jgi:hypothetical protein